MPSRPQIQHLRRMERAAAERRRLNRAMVAPQRDPDSGEVLTLDGKPNRRAAIAQASAQMRSWLVLAPEYSTGEPAPGGHPLMPAAPRRERPLPLLRPWDIRVLDLCLCGLTKAQAAQVLGCTFCDVDTALRRAYRALGVHNSTEAGAAWRARAKAEGHHMNESDEQAAQALTGEKEQAQPLTTRQAEAMALLVQGVLRRDLHIALGCSKATVKSLLRDTYRCLGAHNEREAITRFLERRGGVNQPPYNRPLAAHQSGVRLGDGSKAGSDDDLGPIPPTRYLPP